MMEEPTASQSKLNFQLFAPKLVEEQFDDISRIATYGKDHLEIMRELHRILVNRILILKKYDETSPPMIIYRVTKEYEGIDISLTKAFSYNPKPLESGRAHIKDHGVFYGALDIMTAVAEMKGKIIPNEKFYISTWEIKFQEKTSIHELCINSTTIHDDHEMNFFVRKSHEALGNIIKGVPDVFVEGFKRAVEKMGDLFTMRGEEAYNLTSAYAHEILYENRNKGVNIPIIFYPTVENDQSSINLAIHPSFVDSNQMNLVEVSEVTIKENKINGVEHELNLDIHRKGFPTEYGKLHWYGIYFYLREVNFNELEIEAYNGFHISGVGAVSSKINQSEITIARLIVSKVYNSQTIDEIIQSEDYLVNYKVRDLTPEKINLLWLMYELNYKHEGKIQIQTPTGSSCIKSIKVPIQIGNRLMRKL